MFIAQAEAQDLDEQPMSFYRDEPYAYTKSGPWMVNFQGSEFTGGITVVPVTFTNNQWHKGYTMGYGYGASLSQISMVCVYRAYFDGDHLYACDTNTGLTVLDFNEDFEAPEDPMTFDMADLITRLGDYSLLNVTSMWKSIEKVYLTSPTGFHVVDVSNKSDPVQFGFYAGNYTSGVGTGTTAFILASSGDLIALDCTSNTFSVLDTYTPSFAGEGLHMGNGYVIVGSSLASRLEFVDVSTPADLQQLSVFTSGGASTMHLYQDYLYMPSGRSIMLVNVQNPSTPRVVARYNETESSYDYDPWDDVLKVYGFNDMIISERGDAIVIRSNRDMITLAQAAMEADLFHTTWSSISLGFLAVCALFVVAEVLVVNKTKRGAP